MNIDTAFPSDYLKASDLEGDRTLVIKDVSIETLGSGKNKENKPIIHFKDEEKSLACNKTNAATIKGLYGPDTDDWKGKPITLFPTEVEFQGDMVDAIRVRKAVPSNSNNAPSIGQATAKEALREAWQGFQKQCNGDSQEVIAEAWKALVAAWFPGKTKDTIRADEWRRLIAAKFAMPQTVPAFDPDGSVPADDIPW